MNAVEAAFIVVVAADNVTAGAALWRPHASCATRPSRCAAATSIYSSRSSTAEENMTGMSDTQSALTDQAAREASGSHPYGRYLEEFEVGAVYKHWPAKTVTETEAHLFCLLTLNHHPLHVNDVYAPKSQ